MEIITLIEDSKHDEKLIEEFGLSLLIKTNGKNILFDTGSSENFIKNAKMLGMELQDIDFVVISHAHYDHSGGLKAFLQINDKSKVFFCESADGDYYSNTVTKLPYFLNILIYPLVHNSAYFSKYIGVDKTIFKNYSDRIEFIKSFKEIDKNIFAITDIIKTRPLAKGNKFLLSMQGDKIKPDEFKHELILTIKEDDGLVIFTGCGHSGLLNMVETVKNCFKDDNIKGIVGGFHLKFQPRKDSLAGKRKDIEFIAKELIRHNAAKVYTGHCTGNKAYTILKSIMKDRLDRIYTGNKIQL